MEQVKACFPEYYYEPEVDNKGMVSVNIGRLLRDGYESPILQFFTYLDRTTQKYKLQLRINGGKTNRYYSIDKKADNIFANAVRSIYRDIPNDFSNVKGKKLDAETGLFRSATRYEITPVPDGATGCSITEGGMSLGAKNCNCGFYRGSSRTDAVNTFNSLFDKLAVSLGPEFVYTSGKSQFDMNISKNAETAITFGIKKKKAYESNVPAIVLLFEKYENNTYGVRMLFYKVGF